MQYGEYHKIQRGMLAPLTQYNNREIDLPYISHAQIDVPTQAKQVILNLLKEEGYSYESIDEYFDVATIVLEADDSSDNKSALQYRLVEEGIPHSFYIQNDDDNWKRADFRMKDGELMVHRVSDYSEVIDVHFVLSALENQALTALTIAATNKKAANVLFDFTEEDMKVLKPHILRAIVEG